MTIRIRQRQIMPTGETANSLLNPNMLAGEFNAQRRMADATDQAGQMALAFRNIEVQREQSEFEGFVNDQKRQHKEYMTANADYQTYGEAWNKRLAQIQKQAGNLKHTQSRRWASNWMTENKPLWQHEVDQYTRRGMIAAVDASSIEQIDQIMTVGDYAIETDAANAKARSTGQAQDGPTDRTENDYKLEKVDAIIAQNIKNKVWTPEYGASIRKKAVATQQQVNKDKALQNAYAALYADGRTPDQNMGQARAIVTAATPAADWDTLFDDLEAEQKRYLDRKQVVLDQNAATFVQNVRDHYAGKELETPPSWTELNTLKSKGLIDETGYKAGMAALKGQDTVYDVTDPQTELQILQAIDKGTTTPAAIQALHGKGLSTASVASLSKLAQAEKKLDGYADMLLADLKQQRDAGYFIWGADQRSDSDEEPKRSGMDFNTRMANDEIYNAVEKSFRLWMVDHPDASDKEKQEQYRRLMEPSQNEIALGGWVRFWSGSSDEKESRRRTQWANLVQNKNNEADAIKLMDPDQKQTWAKYKAKGMTITDFVDAYMEVNSGN